MDRPSFLATAAVRPRHAEQFWRLWVTVKMWIRCGWVWRGRVPATRIQARRTRAVFEREPRPHSDSSPWPHSGLASIWGGWVGGKLTTAVPLGGCGLRPNEPVSAPPRCASITGEEWL